MYAIRNWGWFSNFIYDGGLCTFALFECRVYLLFILLLIFVFAALFHSWSVEKKKQKSQEGSFWDSANLCTIPVALSFCKTCCLKYMSSVVFVFYDGICRAVYVLVTLPSLLFFSPRNECVALCLCIYSLPLLLFVWRNLFFFFLSKLWFEERAFKFWSHSYLVGSSFCQSDRAFFQGSELNDWNTFFCCHMHFFFFFYCELDVQGFIDSFWLHEVEACHASLHWRCNFAQNWCMFEMPVLPFSDYNLRVFFFFFSPLKLLTEAADMFSWVLVPLKTAFPAKNSSNACHACPFREFKLHWHYCGNPFALVVDLAWQILPWKLQAHFPE